MSKWCLVLCFLGSTLVSAAEKKAVLIDTDIGSYVDDAFALGLALASPELRVKAVTTCTAGAEDRAWIVCRFLSHSGSEAIPVAYGRDPQPKSETDQQIQYRRHPAAIFNRTHKPSQDSASDVLYRQLKDQPGKTTIVALGPLTNVAALLKQYPDAATMIERIVLMGGSINLGYEGQKKPEPEWNIKTDIAAARTVFAAKVPLTIVPLDATVPLVMEREDRARLFAAHTPLTFQMQALYELWDQSPLVLFDSAAVVAAVDESYFTWESLCLHVDDQGMTTVRKGEANARVATAVKERALLRFFVERITAHGKVSLPIPAKTFSQFVERGRFPARVHVVEDYNTDIEKRWWLCGKPERKDVPPTGERACRATITQDFDDQQGQLKTSYRAVIFNPVPGPPMGENTRLSFRYKLTGSEQLRVQLYSLSKGYHRCVTIDKVPVGEWREATVDLTAMRRPDGKGGPLAKDERIDDIQFYVDPRAELLIDDILLYEAATADDQRPFPERVIFSGWFDTGKQGAEWPGTFEILPHTKPRSWKFAQSVLDKEGRPTLRIGLRGERVLSAKTELTFQYELSLNDTDKKDVPPLKAKPVAIELWHRDRIVSRQEFEPAPTAWRSGHVQFELPKASRIADTIVFRVPRGSRLSVDDVLLYEAGSK